MRLKAILAPLCLALFQTPLSALAQPGRDPVPSSLPQLQESIPLPPRSQGPIGLQQAVDEAVANNLELLARRYDLKIADARIITARMRPNPTLSVEADHLDLLGTRYSAANGAGPAEYSARIDWIFEGGGKRQRRQQVAELEKQVTELRLQEAVRQLILEVQNSFVEMLLARGLLALAHENSQSLERLVRISSERVRAGDLAKVELMRTQLARLQMDNSVIQARLRLQTSRQKVLLLMGRPSFEEAFEIEGDFSREGIPDPFPVLEKKALDRRPDYLAMIREQQRSEAEVEKQIADSHIDYTVGMEYRRQQGLAGTGNSLGFFLSIPLILQDTNEGEIERTRQEAAQIKAQTLALAATIRQELLSAWEQFKTAEALLVRIEQEMLAQSRQVLETMEYSYRVGHASLIELLDAQRAYNETVQSHIEARAEYTRSRYALESMIGGPTQ